MKKIICTVRGIGGFTNFTTGTFYDINNGYVYDDDKTKYPFKDIVEKNEYRKFEKRWLLVYRNGTENMMTLCVEKRK